MIRTIVISELQQLHAAQGDFFLQLLVFGLIKTTLFLLRHTAYLKLFIEESHLMVNPEPSIYNAREKALMKYVGQNS